MSTKIIFLDLDGPMIPSRAYLLENQTGVNQKMPEDKQLGCVVTVFDPVAVGIINNLCAERDWKIVLHSSWVRITGGEKTLEHCIKQGLKAEHFHEEHPFCDEDENWRFTRIAKWLDKHPECEQYVILEDEPYKADIYNYPHPKNIEKHLLLIDFEDGLLMSHYRKIRDGVWHK